jgi:ABC-type cobalamin/Fe3+-siderophores transport system ATPase subunit
VRGLGYAAAIMVMAAATPSMAQETVRLHAAGSLRGSTHDPNHALRAATRAYLLRAGERVADGDTRLVLTRNNLEAIYRAPVRVLTDAKDGANAFLPG